MLIDSHCHLDLLEDADAALARARDAGVAQVITIGVDLATSEDAIVRAHADPAVFATIGLHPHDAKDWTPESWERFTELAGDPGCVGIGEAGLDYHYDHSPRAVQREVFERHVELAASSGKPLVIHTREAWDDTWAILEAGPRVPIVFHCFSGSPVEVERGLGLGAIFSYSGVITFKNAATLRASALVTPLDHLIVETDAPFLAPVPHRGKPCEPGMVADTARFLAELLEIDLETLQHSTVETTRRVFALPEPAAA